MRWLCLFCNSLNIENSCPNCGKSEKESDLEALIRNAQKNEKSNNRGGGLGGKV